MYKNPEPILKKPGPYILKKFRFLFRDRQQTLRPHFFLTRRVVAAIFPIKALASEILPWEVSSS